MELEDLLEKKVRILTVVSEVVSDIIVQTVKVTLAENKALLQIDTIRPLVVSHFGDFLQQHHDTLLHTDPAEGMRLLILWSREETMKILRSEQKPIGPAGETINLSGHA